MIKHWNCFCFLFCREFSSCVCNNKKTEYLSSGKVKYFHKDLLSCACIRLFASISIHNSSGCSSIVANRDKKFHGAWLEFKSASETPIWIGEDIWKPWVYLNRWVDVCCVLTRVGLNQQWNAGEAENILKKTTYWQAGLFVTYVLPIGTNFYVIFSWQIFQRILQLFKNQDDDLLPKAQKSKAGQL